MTVSVNQVNNDAAGRNVSLLATALGLARDYYKVKLDDQQNAKANEYQEKILGLKREELDKDQQKLGQDFLSNNEVVPEGTPGAMPISAISVPKAINLPPNTFIRPRSVSELEAKTRLTSEEKQKDREFKKELAQITAAANGAGDPYKKAPREVQKQVDLLADDTAKKKAIVNYMAPTLQKYNEALANGDTSGAIKIGQGMMKLLNSPLGADAVGTEESKRLGSLLEYQIANLTGPGPVFGRDLEGFNKQVQATMLSVGDAIKNNENELDKLLGREARNPVAAENKQKQQQGGGGVAYGAPGETQPTLQPGTIFKKGGKRYRVNADGETATEI